MSFVAVAGSTFTFGISLEDQANAGLFKAAPTIAAGDFQRSINGGAFSNLDNLPTVSPAAGRRVEIVLSASETTSAAAGGAIYIVGVDASGAEWYDVAVEVRVKAADLFNPASDTVGLVTTVTNLTNLPATAALEATAQSILEDTGTTLPGLMAAELSNTSDSTASGAITRTRGNSWAINATIGAITGYTSLWFTIKHSKDDADSDAILQIKKNASGSDDDLIYVNGATASDSTLGAITVSDASTGAIIIAVDETVTDDMPAGAFYYDVQVLNSGTVTTPDSGTFTITADVTRSVA